MKQEERIWLVGFNECMIHSIVMVSMNDVLANVLDDPFKEIANDYTKWYVCFNK